MPLRLLPSGVDTLYLSARGTVRGEVWDVLDAVKREARAKDWAVLYEFPLTSQAFMVKPHGLRA